MKRLISIISLSFLQSCAGLLPDIATITHDICDSVVSVEVDRDAFKEDTNVEIHVSVINRDPPKQ